jgi:hypothetical protein
MKEFLKKILTWLFSFFNVSIWYDKPTDLDTLLYKLEKFSLLEESNTLRLVYHELVINEAIQTFIMVISLCFLVIAHIDRIWTIMDKLRHKFQSLKNKQK